VSFLTQFITVIYLDADTGHSYTYAQVRSTAIRFGKGLKADWNWQKGDVLALFSPNSIDYPAVTWGCLWAGGIVSPANPAYTADELAFQLRDAGAKGLVTHVSCLETARRAAKKVGLSEDKIILLGSTKHPIVQHFTSIGSTSAASKLQRTKIDPSRDLAFLVYSSGTTGLPKGVMLSHENLACNLQQLKVTESAHLDWKGGPDGQGDKIMGFLPFYHVYGRSLYMSPMNDANHSPALNVLVHGSMYSGFTVIVMEKFDFENFCRLIQYHKATFAYVVPPVVLLLSKHPVVDEYDLSSLRMLMSGAAPMTRELVDAMYERIKVPIKQSYGLSETSPGVVVQVSLV
jgi:4-coumarate--CoA ligase